MGPSLTNPELLSTASDMLLETTIREGLEDTGMPSFAHLGRSGIQAIVTYLRSQTNGLHRSEAVDIRSERHKSIGSGIHRINIETIDLTDWIDKRGKHNDKRPTGYIDLLNDGSLLIVGGLGEILNLDFETGKIHRIESNLPDLIRAQHYPTPRMGTRDVYVEHLKRRDRVFISFTKKISPNCFGLAIVVEEISEEIKHLEFEEFFEISEKFHENS